MRSLLLALLLCLFAVPALAVDDPGLNSEAYCKIAADYVGATSGDMQKQFMTECLQKEKEAKAALASINAPGEIVEQCASISRAIDSGYQVFAACLRDKKDGK